MSDKEKSNTKDKLNDWQQYLKLNDKYVHFNPSEKKNWEAYIAYKAIMENVKLFNLSDDIVKALEVNGESIKEKGIEEAKSEVTAIINHYENFVKSVFNFYNRDVPQEEIKEVAKKLHNFSDEFGLGIPYQVMFKLMQMFYGCEQK